MNNQGFTPITNSALTRCIAIVHKFLHGAAGAPCLGAIATQDAALSGLAVISSATSRSAYRQKRQHGKTSAATAPPSQRLTAPFKQLPGKYQAFSGICQANHPLSPAMGSTLQHALPASPCWPAHRAATNSRGSPATTTVMGQRLADDGHASYSRLATVDWQPLTHGLTSRRHPAFTPMEMYS
jgi:hypothetical protein